jgi:hypothetical protein
MLAAQNFNRWSELGRQVGGGAFPSARCATSRASRRCRKRPGKFAIDYDAEWVNRRVGEWLETFYNADIVAVFGIGGETEYFRSRVAGRAELGAARQPDFDR